MNLDNHGSNKISAQAFVGQNILVSNDFSRNLFLCICILGAILIIRFPNLSKVREVNGPSCEWATALRMKQVEPRNRAQNGVTIETFWVKMHVEIGYTWFIWQGINFEIFFIIPVFTWYKLKVAHVILKLQPWSRSLAAQFTWLIILLASCLNFLFNRAYSSF